MICETCKGAGQVARRIEEPRGLIVEPCPECGGCGIAHCCEEAETGSAASLTRPLAKQSPAPVINTTLKGKPPTPEKDLAW